VAFTDLAALFIANTMASQDCGELADQLHRALDARVVLEQVKGALMAHEGLSDIEAFERMRRQARAERRASKVAAETIERLRPRATPPSIGRRDQVLTRAGRLRPPSALTATGRSGGDGHAGRICWRR
jgi:hypothetical protein